MKKIGFFLNLSTKNSIVKEEPWTHILFLVVEFDSTHRLDGILSIRRFASQECSARNRRGPEGTV